ncbi:MAG TPA: 16S rRNA (adenine(1518)-N(6)/adenine(1519)-N(6))-dimethyltransferase RsmA [Candidatus Acidoferrales bacterium]
MLNWRAMTRQRMGQHFLTGESWQQRILAALPREKDETWIEIGAGHGEMTRLLAERSRRLIAIEADLGLARSLQDAQRRRPDDWRGVEVVTGNVLEMDLAELAGGKFRVYGSLPYYITSPILHLFFGCAEMLKSAHIVIQLEVAERVVAEPGRRDYAYLSAACQFYTRPEIVFRIPPGAFRPPPRVTSALVSMTVPGERSTLKVGDEAEFLKFVQICFSHKRKTLKNNLQAIASAQSIRDALAASGQRPDARAEQLSLADFASLFSSLR